MKYKGDEDIAEWLMGLLAVALLSWFFLSSGRPAWSMGPAISMDIHMAPVWVAGDDPVPYQDWDTSKALDPWHEMFVQQFTLGLLLEEEEREALRVEKLERDKRIAEFRKDNKNFLLLGAFGALIVTLFGTVFYLDKRRRRVKV